MAYRIEYEGLKIECDSTDEIVSLLAKFRLNGTGATTRDQTSTGTESAAVAQSPGPQRRRRKMCAGPCGTEKGVNQFPGGGELCRLCFRDREETGRTTGPAVSQTTGARPA